MRFAHTIALGASIFAAATFAAPAAHAAHETSKGSSRTNLSISVKDSSGGEKTWTLKCNPARGTHPNAEKACALLNTTRQDLFAEVSPDSICVMRAYGSEIARVHGTWKGNDVNTRFSRNNGCQETRWKTAADLLNG